MKKDGEFYETANGELQWEEELGAYWATCPDCGEVQLDSGRNMPCESCDHRPMPTASDLEE